MRRTAGLDDAAIRAVQTEASVSAVFRALVRLVRCQYPGVDVQGTMAPVHQDTMTEGIGFEFKPTELALRVPGWSVALTFDPALPVVLPSPRRLVMEVKGDC